MQLWTDEFKNSRVWALLDELGASLDQALDRTGNDAATVEGLARLKSVLTFCGKRLEGTDPFLLQPGAVDNIAARVESTVQEVKSFVTNGDVGHIANAQSHADAMIGLLAGVNVPLTTGDFVGVKKAAEAYRKGLDSALRDALKRSTDVVAQVDALASRVGELSTVSADERARVLATVSEFQNQFRRPRNPDSVIMHRSKESARLNSNNWSQTRQQRLPNKRRRSRISAPSTLRHSQPLSPNQPPNTSHNWRAKRLKTPRHRADRGDAFQRAMTEHSANVEAQRITFSKLVTDAEAEQKAQLDQLKAGFVATAGSLRDEIVRRKEEVEKLVGVIGNLGVTSGYLTTANEARTTARVWQGVTVLSMLGFIGVAYTAFLPSIQGTFSWAGFAGRVFVSLSVAVLAAYGGSQADKYQKIERQNRRLALELEAIGPFIAPCRSTNRKRSD